MIWGTARKVSSLAAFLAGSEAAQKKGEGDPFFVIVLSEPIWETLTTAQKRALIDHELCHCQAIRDYDRDGNEVLKLSLRGHDVEEFGDVIDRHGLWKRDVKAMADRMRDADQTLMDFTDEEEAA